MDLVQATREPETRGLERLARLIEYGASPRASIELVQAAPRRRRSCRAAATSRRRTSRRSRPTCCATASLLSYEAEAEDKTADDVVRAILDEARRPGSVSVSTRAPTGEA